MKKVLNVGGNNRKIGLPKTFEAWQHVLLDIDPKGRPDVLCDARELSRLPAAEYDAVYCSHNLEHYYRHEVQRVLAGFLHVLKPNGFVHIRVPDMEEVMQLAAERELDIEDVLYQSSLGPITVHDVIYGYGREIAESGSDFYAHKTGFSPKSLARILVAAGFPHVYVDASGLEIQALAFSHPPDEAARTLLDLPTA